MFVLWATGADVTMSPASKTSKHVPLPHCHLGTPQDSGQFPQPFASQAERILGAGAGLLGVGQAATALSGLEALHLALSIPTSKILPSILSCHAGIPWPVSKLWVGSPVSGCCHIWPETVWLRNIRSVRGTYSYQG